MYLVNKNAQQIYDQTLYLWPCSILRFLVLVLSVLVPRACGVLYRRYMNQDLNVECFIAFCLF